MILAHGLVKKDECQAEILKSLKTDCLKTIADQSALLTPEIVINACDILGQKVLSGEFDYIIQPMLSALDIPHAEFLNAVQLFQRESLEYKCQIELGADYKDLPKLKNGTTRKRYPLGILFHIAAGNVDGLPAYSVVEGLLVGNINILKLPSGDSGLSIKLLYELIKIEPRLKDYIYVFDVPSTEIETLKLFANIADGVVVWGGDLAVKAAREMADVTTKVISWGHKLSFAYATVQATEEQLEGLARHICETNQILCSSCQGIFVDTGSKEEQETFGKRFFAAFRRVNAEFKKVSVGMRAKNAINLYNERLEQHETKRIIFSEDGISVILYEDHELELSYLFRNVWIKRLPRDQIVEALKYKKNYLQTCGLLCHESDFQNLSGRLAQAGVVRITKGKDMSQMFSGESHDGTFPLREYSRIVEID